VSSQSLPAARGGSFFRSAPVVHHLLEDAHRPTRSRSRPLKSAQNRARASRPLGHARFLARRRGVPNNRLTGVFSASNEASVELTCSLDLLEAVNDGTGVQSADLGACLPLRRTHNDGHVAVAVLKIVTLKFPT
jgi:hypothetical protein